LQLSALKSLWDLFRGEFIVSGQTNLSGKRWNTLRQRTDSHAYDLDTLFLGTLLFTLMTFLAPTALAYAALFAVINFAIVSVVRLLTLASGALDTLPMHELESRVIKPSRIPGKLL
jgi:phosphatidylinositol glycan class Q protein